MNSSQLDILSMLRKHMVFTSILCLTLCFFLAKGFRYFLIGSYVPLVCISTIVILLAFGFLNSMNFFRKIIRIWGSLLLLWSAVRLLFSFINQFVKPIPESHVSEQLGISGTMLSVLFLAGAIYLFWYSGRIFKK